MIITYKLFSKAKIVSLKFVNYHDNNLHFVLCALKVWFSVFFQILYSISEVSLSIFTLIVKSTVIKVVKRIHIQIHVYI